MAKSMTLEEVKKSKMELELQVVKIFKQFEEDTELKISYIDVVRKRKKRESEEKEYNMPDVGQRGPIEDVKINVDLDLVY